MCNTHPEIKIPTLLNGRPVPPLIYGTAHRNGKNPPDVREALERGYRAVDTASSRRYHREDEDGRAISAFLVGGSPRSASRDDIFIQSKYSPLPEQEEPGDHDTSWAYEIKDDTTSRVLKSVLRSAANLEVDVLDVYMLQTPLNSIKGTLEAWHALELVARRGGVRYLGICNVRLSRLQQVFERVEIKPAFVQNWFRRSTGYDREVAIFCRDHGIVYQIFGVFDDDNKVLLDCEPVRRQARLRSVSEHQALLQMLLATAERIGLRLCVMDGTTSSDHMAENLKTVAQMDKASDADIQCFSNLIGWARQPV
ncbi:hypothetical protein DL765_008489 [Monosporascus sp. GIB2]|nr:hypothetical protein DL765_008489 [Monosporascus sp. GIB2]